MSNIEHPSHYNQGILPGECINYVKYLDFCRGNVIKYLWRYQGKNGVEDIRKAAWYCDFITQNPGVIAGELPKELSDKLSNDCYQIFQDSSLRNSPVYDFAMCIHTLVNLDPEEDTINTVFITQMFSKVIKKRAENF